MAKFPSNEDSRNEQILSKTGLLYLVGRRSLIRIWLRLESSAIALLFSFLISRIQRFLRFHRKIPQSLDKGITRSIKFAADLRYNFSAFLIYRFELLGNLFIDLCTFVFEFLPFWQILFPYRLSRNFRHRLIRILVDFIDRNQPTDPPEDTPDPYPDPIDFVIIVSP